MGPKKDIIDAIEAASEYIYERTNRTNRNDFPSWFEWDEVNTIMESDEVDLKVANALLESSQHINLDTPKSTWPVPDEEEV